MSFKSCATACGGAALVLAITSFASVAPAADLMVKAQPPAETPFWIVNDNSFSYAYAFQLLFEFEEQFQAGRRAEAEFLHQLHVLGDRHVPPQNADQKLGHAVEDLLPEPELRQIALWKVEGYTNEEIATRLDCVSRTIERKVSRIRLLWKCELKEFDP